MVSAAAPSITGMRLDIYLAAQPRRDPHEREREANKPVAKFKKLGRWKIITNVYGWHHLSLPICLAGAPARFNGCCSSNVDSLFRHYSWPTSD